LVSASYQYSRFAVLPHQHPYAWLEEQLRELYRDITHAKNRRTEEYFLGTILLANAADGRQSIINGQSRFLLLKSSFFWSFSWHLN
jgi:uncharacterized protein with ParB-like and HNH nuclease domain